jgi:hypothetical protein
MRAAKVRNGPGSKAPSPKALVYSACAGERRDAALRGFAGQVYTSGRSLGVGEADVKGLP